MCQECFKCYRRKFQGSLKQVSSGFQDGVKYVLRVFLGSFKGVSSVFRRCFKKVSRRCSRCFKFYVAWHSSQLPKTKAGGFVLKGLTWVDNKPAVRVL